MGVSQNWGYLFGGPYNKDYSILGSILGSPYFGKLPYEEPPFLKSRALSSFSGRQSYTRRLQSCWLQSLPCNNKKKPTPKKLISPKESNILQLEKLLGSGGCTYAEGEGIKTGSV